MSSPDDGTDARSSTEGAAGTATREARVNAPRAGDGISSGSTRTPPPRTRRGAPVKRGAPADVVEPEPPDPDVAWDAKPRPDSSAGKRTGAASTAKKSTGSSTTERTKSSSASATPATPASSATSATPATKTTRTTKAAAPLTLAATAPALDDLEPEPAFEPAPKPRPQKAKRQERRFRQTIQKVDLWSVTKMALCFYVSAMGVVIVALVALWTVADSAGIIDNVENFIGDLFSSEDFHFVSGQVLRGAVLASVVLVALMVVFTIIAASFYNIFAELFGGIEVVIREEEQPPKR